jgi:hypothetical protein
MTTWHKGPPPSVGWWPASSYWEDAYVLRWWNGEYWSRPAEAGFELHQVAATAALKDPSQHLIEWTDRPAWWPERSKT